MKFPITRESLQGYNHAKEQEELLEAETQKHILQILDDLCKDFTKKMPSNTKEKRYIWRGIGSIASQNGRNGKPLYPEFILRLEETFVGCDIIVDPLKTYIIIDWN